MKTVSPGGSGSSVSPDESAGALRVELVSAPLSAEHWASYEAVNRSYTCTRAFIEYFERPSDPGLALVRDGSNDVRAAFLFQYDGSASVRLLGRLFAPPPDAFRAFVEAVLARYPAANRVETDLLDAFAEPGVDGRPTLTVRKGVELRVPLGGAVEEYHRSLDPEFLRRSARHERKLFRSTPAARFSTLEDEGIPREWIAQIVQLNRARMSTKHTDSVFDAHYEEGIFTVARKHGCVTVLFDGERICAGAITIRCGPESFGWVLAHDEAYAGFRPGRLCALANMRHLAGRGVRTHHMLAGDSPYKRELGGRPVPLASYLVLRSWAALTPVEVGRLALARTALVARGAIAAADAVAARTLDRQGAVTSLARDVVHRGRWIARALLPRKQRA